MHFHIGHHFFGSGNIGDDWMLAGFFDALDSCGAQATFSCCTPFDRIGQSVRFPRIEWLPYDASIRRATIARADGWLGLGDTPFQSDTGSWFLEHLDQERSWCAELNVPIWFVGVGVNNREVFCNPRARAIAGSAVRIWTRDAGSAQWIADAAGERIVEAATDLSHAFFADATARVPVPPGSRARRSNALAMCLNFEDRSAFDVAAIEALVGSYGSPAWLVQEIRALEWSERTILSMLAGEARKRLDVIEPDYLRDTSEAMLERWGRPALGLSSRYHAATALAWLGVPTVAVVRNDKLQALADDLTLGAVRSLKDSNQVAMALAEARPVARTALSARAARTREMVSEWARAAGASKAASPSAS